SRPPASARLAAGTVADLFAPASDVHPRLLAAAEPRIAEHLHLAWTNARLAEPAALSGLQAMRIKATPFGATAPPKLPERPQEPWPIPGMSQDERVTLEVTATYAEDGWPATATVTYTDGGRTAATGTITLDRQVRATTYLFADSAESGEPAFDPGAVVHWADEAGDRFVLHTVGRLPDRIIHLHRRADDGTIVVFIGDGAGQATAGLPADGGSESRAFGVDTVQLTRSGDEVTVDDTIAQAAYLLPLDAVYDGITVDSRVILERPGWDKPLITRVTKVEQIALAEYGLVAKVTRLTLADPWLALADEFPAIRETTVWARGEEVAPAEDPLPGDVGGDRIELAGMYEGLRPGRWLIVSGERTDVPYTDGVPAAELVLLAGIQQRIDPAVPGDAVHPTLVLANELSYTYRRATVKIHGNVVEATQGETHAGETLGSGDAAQAGQSFQLARAPLMWLPAANPLGAESTLTAAVGGVRWPETDGLVWLGATDRGYQTGTGDDGKTTLVFGDGVHGARLPTGVENITATYRTGEGEAGNVVAGQINQLAGRPLGVNAVVNPLAATGGTRADGPGDTRSVLPLRTLALDRLVSVRDYEDFARARAGIGKASAQQLFDGEREVVHLTIAGVDDAPIDPTSRLFTALESALAELGDAHLPVRVALRELVLIVLSAGVAVLPDHTWDRVEPAVRAALLDTFSFARRDLGRPAFLSEALAAAQAVPGVDYVDVDVFGHVPGDIDAADLVKLADRLTEPDRCVPARPAISTVRRYEPGTWWTLTAVARRFGLTVEELVRLNPGVDTAELDDPTSLVVGRGILPAQLAVLSADLPETLILRRIP
ncbi:MAG: putative baseplate assembly protein, partial [Actinomadura sp.]